MDRCRSGNALMRRQLIVAVLAQLLALSVLWPAVSQVEAAPPLASQKLLYHWTMPRSGHTGAWIYKQGVLTYAGASNASIFAPVTLPNITDFAMQARIRSLGPGGP